MKYTVYYQSLFNMWLVINNETKLAHSMYKLRKEAYNIASDLNAQIKRFEFNRKLMERQ